VVRYFPEGEFHPHGAKLVPIVDSVGNTTFIPFGSKLISTKDHLGNVANLVDAATGVVLSATDYTPYGQIKSGSADADVPYAGLYRDSALGLYYSSTRAYDASIGRWLSRDTIEEEGGLNLYGYADMDPIDRSDPDGKDAPFVGGAGSFVGGVGGGAGGIVGYAGYVGGVGLAFGAGAAFGYYVLNPWLGPKIQDFLDDTIGPANPDLADDPSPNDGGDRRCPPEASRQLPEDDDGHKTNKRHWDKHTKPRPGKRGKNSKIPPNPNKMRPQDMPPKEPK
jgi:RHS repeat-associated protein